MNAIIIAAGLGTRLLPMTEKIPKTLVQVNGKPMLGYILDALIKNNIKNIFIVVGYKKESIINFCKKNYPNLNINFIDNPKYDKINEIYSLYCARNYMRGETLILNADVIFESKALNYLLSEPNSSLLVDYSKPNIECAKFIVDENKILTAISIDIPKEQSNGLSLDIFKLNSKESKIFINAIINVIKKQKTSLYRNDILNNLFQTKKLLLKIVDVRKSKWYEIDNIYDLKEAEKIFS